MKPKVHVLALLLAIFCGSYALAAVDPLDVMEISPAEGTVTSLQSFTITFGDLTVVVNEDAIPTLQKAGGEYHDGGMMADDEGTTVFVDFEERLTESGQYTLMIPAGAITVDGQPLESLSFRYNIQGSAGSFYDQISIDPAEGEVESLQYFTIHFPAYVGEIKSGSVATLTNTTTGVAYELEMIDSGYDVIAYMSDEVTEPGNYQLDIPGGAVIIYTLDGEVLPLRFNYTIKGGDNTFYDQISIDPAEGVVERLQYFTIHFPAYVGEIESGRVATLTNTTTGVAYELEMIDTGYDVIAYMGDEVTEPGDYTLTIPAGSVIIYTLDGEVQELNFHYTIEGGTEPSFYDQISIDPAEGVVERLQYFTIHFPAYVGEIESGRVATLTNTTTGVAYELEMIDSGYDVIAYMSDEVTEPGDYTLTIPAGSVIIYTLDGEVQELNFHYTIAGTVEQDYTINPAEGEVYLLQNFTIDYESPVEVDEDAHPVLTNDETGASYECNMFEVGGNAFIYMEYPLSVLGHYTLSVPAGCIQVPAAAYVNPEMTFRYEIVEKDTFVPYVIENQPEGELRLYQRTGGVVREVEKEEFADDESPYEIIYEPQDGSINIVFGDNNKVYIQRPVSWSYYDGWVEGTLSEDGKTITVPMGQYVAYTFTMEMAVQVAVFTYDEYENSYFYDDSVTEVTFTINDDGSISMNGTDEKKILGTMNRVFGEQFHFLDYEWLQSGDYASVYVPAVEQPQTPPEGIETESFYLTTANFDGSEWEPYKATVTLGFDGDDVWMQGISKYLPEAWIKGYREGNTIVFPNTQLLGAYEALLYFKCASLDLITGATTDKDMVLTFDGVDTYTTYDYVFISTDKNSLSYVNYYQGLTLSRHLDAVIEVPEDLEVEPYYFTFLDSENVETNYIVHVGFQGNEVYIQGLWEYMPDAWVKGYFEDGKFVMELPIYFGDYEMESNFSYPIYLIGFDEATGDVVTQVTFDVDSETGVISNPSSAIGMGINKTGYLNLQDFYNAVFTPVNQPSSVISTIEDVMGATQYYDLQGRQLKDPSTASGIVIVKNADGTVTKVLRK